MIKKDLAGIRLVIFDLDGTLVDAYAAIGASFNYTLRRLGYPKKDALSIRRGVGFGDRNLLKSFVKPAELDKALLIYRKHHQKSLVRKSRLFPGAGKLLYYLKNRRYKLSVASNRPTRFSKIIIRHLGLDKYFDYVLCADKLKSMKPNPRILRRIMRRLKAAPKDTLYIGDMDIDARTGRRAGIRTIIVTTGSSSRREIQKEHPYRIVNKLSDLLKIF